MSQTAIEKEICGSCGANVRPQADYCYNCGAAVSVVAVGKKPALIPVEKSEIRGDDSAPEILVAEKSENETAAEAAKIKTASENAAERPPLKSAASMRRKSKSIERKTVEIVWNEHENAPNAWFIAVAIFLTLVAAGILFLAMQLK